MGYVAVKGGTEAIDHARELVEFYRLKDATLTVGCKTNSGSDARCDR